MREDRPEIKVEITTLLADINAKSMLPEECTRIFQNFAYKAIKTNMFSNRERQLLAWALFQPEYHNQKENRITLEKKGRETILCHKNNNVIVTILQYLKDKKVTVYDFHDAAHRGLNAIIAFFKKPTFKVYRDQKLIIEVKNGEEVKQPEPEPVDSSGFFSAIYNFFAKIFSAIGSFFSWLFNYNTTKQAKALLKKIKDSADNPDTEEHKIALESMAIVNGERDAIKNFRNNEWFCGPTRTRIRKTEAILRDHFETNRRRH